ncbi:AraC family transcriptional regulator [Luteibacter jiangsuensis]|uniref:AraC family transcriptional regulator n=1 Tax=Luteibacter jiangsuensis TaxID=637577 RepID=A0ABT9T071_9GAMM|nr:AraC family transcriptional regulator [Luteibacter jiangsuensis]MDQ0010665.1 AraC family transcriptional regulator [Luteibacter jiangsuensis]
MTDLAQERWFERMAAAAALLTGRLDVPPSLEELAAAAHVSPFHFHRIWRGLTGEAVGATIARLRIEASQQKLRAAGGSVTSVAMETGFATPQAFARAFRRLTGTTPSNFARGEPVSARSLPDSDVRIVLREPVEIVVLRRVGADYVAMNKAYGQLWAWAESEGLLENLQGIYGVAVDDAASVTEGESRYEACLALHADAPPPFLNSTLRGGRYASLTHQGSYDGLPAAEAWLMGHWLAGSSYEPADAPLVHHFLNDPDATPEAEWLTEVLLPLRDETH